MDNAKQTSPTTAQWKCQWSSQWTAKYMSAKQVQCSDHLDAEENQSRLEDLLANHQVVITRTKKNKKRKQAKGRKQKGQDRPRWQNGKAGKGKPNGCVRGSLDSCVEGCPGEFGARVFGACIKSCDKRC